MLDQEQRVGFMPGEHSALGLLLDGERRAVFQTTQASDSERSLFHVGIECLKKLCSDFNRRGRGMTKRNRRFTSFP
jgi:hypothetical protein